MLSLQGVKAKPSRHYFATDERLLALEVLGRHRNRLRKGHHAGNQFRLVIPGCSGRSQDDRKSCSMNSCGRASPTISVRNGKGDRGRTFNWVPSCSRRGPSEQDAS